MSGIEHLREVSNVLKFKKGELILREGETDNPMMYIILLGETGVYRGYGTAAQVRVSLLKKGDFFGEMRAFLDTKRVASVVALTETTVLEIARDNIATLFSKMPSMAYAIIRTLCARLQESNERYATLHAQLRTDGGQAVSPEALSTLIEDAPSITPVLIDDAPEEEPASAAPAAQAVAVAQAEPKVQAAPVAKAAPVAYPPNALFPPGHKHYSFPDTEQAPAMVGESSCTCPMCDHVFKVTRIRNSKLRLLTTDPDLRSHFQGVEPIYYLTLTCPNCYFSAIRDTFTKAMTNRKALITEKTAPIKSAMSFDFTGPLTADTAFASMFLALQCVPFAYTGKEMITARIWRHLCWLYRDCGDAEMEQTAIRTAYEQYLHAYETVDIPASSMQSVCYIIGDLSERVDDIPTAKKFFYSARTNRDGGALMRSMAEDRLNDIRAREAANPLTES